MISGDIAIIIGEGLMFAEFDETEGLLSETVGPIFDGTVVIVIAINTERARGAYVLTEERSAWIGCRLLGRVSWARP